MKVLWSCGKEPECRRSRGRQERSPFYFPVDWRDMCVKATGDEQSRARLSAPSSFSVPPPPSPQSSSSAEQRSGDGRGPLFLPPRPERLQLTGLCVLWPSWVSQGCVRAAHVSCAWPFISLQMQTFALSVGGSEVQSSVTSHLGSAPALSDTGHAAVGLSLGLGNRESNVATQDLGDNERT